jgi:hypothetical protein
MIFKCRGDEFWEMPNCHYVWKLIDANLLLGTKVDPSLLLRWRLMPTCHYIWKLMPTTIEMEVDTNLPLGMEADASLPLRWRLMLAC